MDAIERKEAYFRNQILFWSGSFICLLLFVWLFNAILLPFVLGIAVAYLLNPMVKSLGRVGFSRQAATIVILSGFLIILGVFLAITVPVLYREISELANDLPGLFERLSNMAAPYQNRFQELVGQDGSNPIALLKEQAGNSLAAGKTILSGLKAGGAAITSFFTVIIVMPIVAYFMMEEWPRLLNWVEGLMPRPHKDTIMDLLGEMDKKVAGFVRGQISVAAMLGIMYAIGLSLAGLNYGFLIGFFAGIFCIIPMVGSTLGLFVGILVAWLQTGELSYVALIGGIFIAGQIIEGNFLTPKIVGDKVGLHPLWVFFALMAGGALFGVVGMLIAVPVAAVISVMVGFLIEQYKRSSYYLGLSEDEVTHDVKLQKAAAIKDDSKKETKKKSSKAGKDAKSKKT